MKFPLDLAPFGIDDEEDDLPDGAFVTGVVVMYEYQTIEEGKPRVGFVRSPHLNDWSLVGMTTMCLDRMRKSCVDGWEDD